RSMPYARCGSRKISAFPALRTRTSMSPVLDVARPKRKCRTSTVRGEDDASDFFLFFVRRRALFFERGGLGLEIDETIANVPLRVALHVSAETNDLVHDRLVVGFLSRRIRPRLRDPLLVDRLLARRLRDHLSQHGQPCTLASDAPLLRGTECRARDREDEEQDRHHER